MRIYVGGLPYSTNNEGLRRLFAQAGEVAEASVVEDRFSGQSKGFGFVDMPNDEEAKAAIAKFDGFNMEGRNLTVNEAKPVKSAAVAAATAVAAAVAPVAAVVATAAVAVVAPVAAVVATAAVAVVAPVAAVVATAAVAAATN